MAAVVEHHHTSAAPTGPLKPAEELDEQPTYAWN
jgi:hypothetical protein